MGIFAVPASFFESISIISGEGGLIFEGLDSSGGYRNERFCEELPGVNPQRSDHGTLLWILFWDMLSHKEAGTAFGLVQVFQRARVFCRIFHSHQRRGLF